MHSTNEAEVYQSPPAAVNFSAGAYPALLSRYVDGSAIVAALAVNGVPTYGVYVPFRGETPDKYLRCSLGLALVGGDGTQMLEQTYLAFGTGLDGSPGHKLEKVMDITWTAGTVAIPVAVGGRANHVEAKNVAIVETGVLVSRTGITAGQVSQTPARVDILDVGEAVGIVRLFSKPGANAATGCAPLGQRWR